MQKLFKDFKPSVFGILFIILIIVAIMTWFVPAGEYTYECQNPDLTFVYDDVSQTQAVCAIDQQQYNQLVLAQSEYQDDSEGLVSAINEIVDNNKSNEQPEFVYQRLPAKRQGLWNVIQAPVDGFIKAIEIIAFVFAIGGFINIVIKSGAMDAGIYTLLRKFKGKEIWLIPILMTLFALGGTTFGMCEETIVFYVVLIPILFRAGFDNVLGVLLITVGAGAGLIAGTINPFAIGVASSQIGISPGDGLIGRIIFFIIVLVISILYVMHYAKKVKNDPSKSICYDKYSDLEKEFSHDAVDINNQHMLKGHKIILILFIMTFVLMILAVIPWANAFNITIFESITNTINNFVIPFVGGDGGILAFGDWYFVEMTGLFLAGSFVIGCVAKATGLLQEPIMPIFIDGAKDMMSVGLIIALARGIQSILENSGMAPTILYYSTNILSNLPKSLFSILVFVLYLPLSFLIPSTSGLATTTMPIVGDLAQSIFGSSAGKVQVITAFCAASGVISLIAPTTGVFMVGLDIAKMEFGKWLKLVMPLVIILIIVSCLFLALTTMFNFYA